jgi:hypothetical protein
MPKQLDVGWRVRALLQPLPCVGYSYVGIEATHFCRNAKVSVTIQKVLVHK